MQLYDPVGRKSDNSDFSRLKHAYIELHCIKDHDQSVSDWCLDYKYNYQFQTYQLKGNIPNHMGNTDGTTELKH